MLKKKTTRIRVILTSNHQTIKGDKVIKKKKRRDKKVAIRNNRNHFGEASIKLHFRHKT